MGVYAKTKLPALGLLPRTERRRLFPAVRTNHSSWAKIWSMPARLEEFEHFDPDSHLSPTYGQPLLLDSAIDCEFKYLHRLNVSHVVSCRQRTMQRSFMHASNFSCKTESALENNRCKMKPHVLSLYSCQIIWIRGLSYNLKISNKNRSNSFVAKHWYWNHQFIFQLKIPRQNYMVFQDNT